MEHNANADADNGQRDERSAPAPGGGDAGGDERCQEVARTAADHVNAERLATGSRFLYRRYQGGGGGVVTTTQYTHQHESDDQYNIVWRYASQQSGCPHAGDADGEQDTRSEAVGQPSGWQLAYAVYHTKRRYYKSGAGVIQGEFVADIGQEWHRQGCHQVVGKMCQYQ